MAELIDALPGIALPVGEVTARLASMWDGGPASSGSEFRASQMNVVLHFGLDVTAEEARERFDESLGDVVGGLALGQCEVLQVLGELTA